MLNTAGSTGLRTPPGRYRNVTVIMVTYRFTVCYNATDNPFSSNNQSALSESLRKLYATPSRHHRDRDHKGGELHNRNKRHTFLPASPHQRRGPGLLVLKTTAQRDKAPLHPALMRAWPAWKRGRGSLKWYPARHGALTPPQSSHSE